MAQHRRQPPGDELRALLTRSREEAIEQLRRLGISPAMDQNEPLAGVDSVLDQGDVAQASESQEMAYATRERLAARITRLTAALGRIEDGTFGNCTECGGPIGPARLAALPEAETCLRCQEQRERAKPGRAA